MTGFAYTRDFQEDKWRHLYYNMCTVSFALVCHTLQQSVCVNDKLYSSRLACACLVAIYVFAFATLI